MPTEQCRDRNSKKDEEKGRGQKMAAEMCGVEATFAEQPLRAGGASPAAAYLSGELCGTRISLPRATRRAG